MTLLSFLEIKSRADFQRKKINYSRTIVRVVRIFSVVDRCAAVKKRSEGWRGVRFSEEIDIRIIDACFDADRPSREMVALAGFEFESKSPFRSLISQRI